VLYGGFVTQTGPFWSIIHSRPGNSPIVNLTNSILDGLLQSKRIEEEDIHIHRAIINSILRSGPHGLVEIARYIQQDESENVFFLLDQFEELFRYADGGNEDSVNEATAYVNLILTAVQQQAVPIYIALSMRSDFVGDCASYHGLSEMINASNYLVPQMTRDQKRMAVEGPVTVSGGKIAPRLLKRLLNDIGDNQDQLPILQHAMMRTWDYWVTNHDPGEPLDLRHYNAIGKIAQALSLHANEAFEELNTRQKEIAEILFKALTEKSQEIGMRRPVRVGLISELSDAQEKEVIDVVDNFRRPGRSFLMPGSGVALKAETVIELSHESLMRIWTRLSVWVDEESESALMYKRVSDAAAMYQIGRTSLWRPPDLQLALNWQKKQRPTRVWAQRYDVAFERAIVFLDTSRITYEAELKNQEMLQRRMLRRARVTNIILAIFTLIAIAFMFYGLINKIAADQRLVEANAQKENAILASKEANEQRVLADKRTQEVIDKQSEIERQRDQLAKFNSQLAVALKRADSLRVQAERGFAEAKVQRDSARLERDKATREYTRAEKLFNESNDRLMLSIAQSLEAKSEGIDDKDLAGSTAMQGYLFHTKFGGKKYDPYVFRGLYYALTKLSGANYNSIKVAGSYKSKMFALAVSQKTSSFFTTGNDGRIFQGDFLTQKADKIINEKDFPNRVLALSKDEKYLVNGSDSTYMEIFNLSDPGRKPLIVNGHSGLVTDIKFLPDNSGFISSSIDRTLRLNQITGESKRILSLPFDIKSIDISANGKLLVAASTSGKLIMVDLKDFSFKEIKDEAPNRILSVAFHPSRPLVAYGVEVVGEKAKGTVKLLNINTQKVEKELGGHKAGISDLEFSPDGLLLASAGLDRKLQMWVVDHVEDLPIVMDNNNGFVWKLSFSKGSDYLIASFNDGEVRVWPTDPKMLADQVCPKLGRNMTPEEWDIYVGNNVTYESTCKNLLIKSF
jgi:WD40 repeat protein